MGLASLGLALIATASAIDYLGSATPRTAVSAGAAGAAAPAGAASAASAAPVAGAAAPAAARTAAPGVAAGPQQAHIVVLREAALGAYRGETAGLPAPQRRLDARGKLRLDARGSAARAYVNHLQNRQQTLEGDIARTLQRPLQVKRRMQHAVNGIVVELDPAEAAAVRALPEVLFVEEYREYALDTDTGPRHIGAEAVWTGTYPGAAAAYQGEGVVVGVLDTGINFGSPSFAAVDPVDGYVHVNPLGEGNYLGTCAPGGVDAGRCNAKLIGGYDFVCGAPGNACGVAGIREEPGFGDTNNHGSHVASTAAGNKRDVVFRGNPLRISGVAPRANVVAFDICYTNIATNQGSCPNTSAVAAINQAVADGVVDVINYSIGGGASPWSDAVSLAFLGASDAGIYVAASAGNSGPGPNTMGHHQPWVASTAAAQHGRGTFAVTLEVTGPAPVPEPLAPVLLSEGTGGVPHESAIPGTTPLKASPGFDTASDACAALPADTFAGAIAVVRRGTCAFSDKVNNAAAAGAIAVVVANNAEGAIVPSVPGTSVRAFGVTQDDGIALRDFARAHADATAAIGFPPLPLPNTPDALASFSSRGPAGGFDLVKPDITAPGASILAAVAGTEITGAEEAIGLLSGTSMASPHHAGAAALVRQVRQDWSVPEIKSALMMTAEPEVWLEDQVTPATPFGKGAGRVQVDRAVNAGLVLHETGDNYRAADPALGGDVSALNQPSLADGHCFRNCSFYRTFRNPHAQAQSYRVRLNGLTGGVTPANVRIAAGATQRIRVLVNSQGLPADGSWHFGEVVLEPVDATVGGQPRPTLRLPVAVAVPAPVVSLPEVLTATLKQGRSGNVAGFVANAGGSTLSFGIANTGTGAVTPADRDRGALTTGYRSVRRTDAGSPVAQFAADDFVLHGETRIESLFAEGFGIGGAVIGSTASALGWAIYPDAGGVPAGNPATAPEAAAWRYLAAPNAPAVTLSGANIGLDLAAAGQDVVLPPGRYWLVVYVHAPYATSWAWYASPEGDGSFAALVVASDGSGSWSPVTSFPGLSLRVQGSVSCGAPWIGATTPQSANLQPGATQSVRAMLSAAGLPVGRHVGHYCVESNDPVTPKAGAPIVLTVTP